MQPMQREATRGVSKGGNRLASPPSQASAGARARRGSADLRGIAVRRGLAAVVIAAGAALAIGVGPGAEALAQSQPGRPGATPSGTKSNPGKQPGKQVSSPNTGPVESIIGKVLKTERSKDWTLRVFLTVRPAERRQALDGQVVRDRLPLKFDRAILVFPMLRETAAHRIEMDPQDQERERVTGVLKVANRQVDVTPEFKDGFPAGTRLGRWEARDVDANEISLELGYMVTCWNTQYDEQLAATVDWPSKWPADAASTFQKQPFLDSEDPKDDQILRDQVKEWTGGEDPKAAKPAVLAKFLTQQTLLNWRSQGEGLQGNQDGSFAGFKLQTAAESARAKRGTEHDLAVYLAAVMRAAGLPARTVIGYSAENKTDEGRILGNRGGYRSWVEFALVDPKENKSVWIPVDPSRIARSGGVRDLDRNWAYFGRHDQLNSMVPVAFQFHPPTTVTSVGPAALWGWLTLPESQPAMQGLRMLVGSSSTRPEDGPRRNRER